MFAKCSRYAPLIALVVIGSVASADSTVPEPRRRYLGRTIAQTMHFAGAPWLVRESRERQEDCTTLLRMLDLKPGQTVCDLGCGNGFYTLKLAERVAPGGEVLAVDIQNEMLEMLAERAEARRVENIEPILGEPHDPKLPERAIDLVLLVDVYHEFSHPKLMLESIYRSLKPKGRVALVEFRTEDPTVPIKPLHKMSLEQCVKEFTANDFKPVGQSHELPWQHVLFFARDDSPLPRIEVESWRPALTPTD